MIITQISATRRPINIFGQNLIKVLEQSSIVQNPKGNLQMPKRNHLGDGVWYGPRKVISCKISACQIVYETTVLVLHIIWMDELHMKHDSQALKVRWKIVRNVTASKIVVARIAAEIYVRLELEISRFGELEFRT